MNVSPIARIQSVRRFEHALNRGVFGQLFDLVRFGTGKLIPLDDVQSMLGFRTVRVQGRVLVPLDRIIGSEGRSHQFSRSFLPKSPALKNRWTSIYRAVEAMESLPPVQLYELGGYYFVRDGNHRVSVARNQKFPSIEAEVSSIDFPARLGKAGNLEEIKRSIKEVQRDDFFRKCAFSSEPDRELLNTTFLLGYEKIYRTVLESGLSPDEWLKKIFMPAIELIEREKLAKAFPGRTKADIYLLFRSFIHLAEDKELAMSVLLRQADRRRSLRFRLLRRLRPGR